MGDYRRLNVWHKARALRRAAYRLTDSFPVEERYGLKAQIRRASTSIMANIAEGCGRGRDGELAHFASIALGSATELESLFTSAEDQGLLPSDLKGEVTGMIAEVKRMLTGLIKRLRLE